jgi:methylaspartate mutase epsilon subunit
VKDYHLKKLEGRAQAENRPLDFDMLVSDLQYASRIAPQV